ncbi:NACHT domain-containing protein [Diplocloster agilis]|uniref:Uncharacterized protein n=1 Tax=Diplocloster agilis TaxID=2850323 RepID=A0A949NG81_9FIRM|nr:hypothetical protein [Diplocloster agilis]MBU9736113.1 hypothetical protein [Diplocloster agilis]
MEYKVLNKNQKDRMQVISDHAYVMEWESPEFMDYLLGKLPKVRKFQEDKEVAQEVSALEILLTTYNAFLTKKSSFVDEIAKRISDIHDIKESWYGLSLYEIETYIKLHSFCLILGEGGIGKSYFIKCFEEQLEQKHIEHLCIYGKFEKNTNNINVEEIIKASNNGFVFVVDAINEMSVEGQNNLLDVLMKLKKYPQIRIVITYRTNSMDNEILEKYQQIAEYEYKFPGVSFESALSEILKLSVPDVYMYEDILYSNNALLLSMLCDVLSSDKVVVETENGIASVTFILEQYIKRTIRKVFKGHLNCQGIDIWKDMKNISQWMYENGEKRIDEKNLFLAIKTGKNFLPVMLQMGFMAGYESNNEMYYYFAIDSLTDFLIARSLFQDISGRDYKEQIGIIKSKVEDLYNLEEALIIAIFDNMSPNYTKIKDLLIDTNLMEGFDFNTLVKIHFKQEEIATFQELFQPIDHSDLLQAVGGYTDKPFNCSNYLFDYYCASRERLYDLSNALAGYHFQSRIKNRLKNVLYFTTLNDRTDRRDEEAFYFALLCCAAPNKDIRCLAMKLLYEVVSKNEEYVDRVIFEYDRIFDFYIQEATIYVLSQIRRDNERIINFFNRIISQQDDLTAKSIRRIATYFGKPYSYIMWNRKNLFAYSKEAAISDYLNDILFRVDLMNKDFLPFRYWGKDHLDMYTRFLVNDKENIKKVNDYLSEKYSCVCGGECSGLMSFENRIMPEIKPMAEIETMDMNSFMESFEAVFRYVFEYFSVSTDRKTVNMREEDFRHSLYMKCVDIATGIYYGSLMCNYYTNRFVTYNNNQNSIGYEVYDPLEYGENVVITAPIPTYQDFIERLGDHVINSLEVPEVRDIHWVRNVELTRKNVLHLLEKIELRKQEWILLACRVSLHEENKYDTRWKDTYDLWCCTSENETINEDGSARYLTIELEEYVGDLKSYSDNSLKPWLCKDVKNINNQSEVFEGTSLVLPPSEIISFFNLRLNVSDFSWETSDKEKIIICNNNKNSYYRDPIGGTVFIRKDYFDKFLEGHTVKYFAFTERFIPKTGYADETSLHFEIINGKIVKEIKNAGGYGRRNNENNPLCTVCPHTNIVEDESDDSLTPDIECLKNVLAEYGVADDFDMLGEEDIL